MTNEKQKDNEAILLKMSQLCYLVDKTKSKTVFANEMIKPLKEVISLIETRGEGDFVCRIRDGIISELYKALSALYKYRLDESIGDSPRLKDWVLKLLREQVKILSSSFHYRAMIDVSYSPIVIMFSKEGTNTIIG